MPDKAVPASGRLTGRRATVVIPPVTIVTGLTTSPQIPITTVRGEAIDQASIFIGVVAIITLFPAGPDHTIAANSTRAVVQALVLISLITVITFHVTTDEGVATTYGSARHTAVIIVFIAIITGLAGSHHAIATPSEFTIIAARVGVRLVPIVAGLTRSEVTIATPGHLTGRQTVIVFIRITVITGFARPHNPITTPGPATVV